MSNDISSNTFPDLNALIADLRLLAEIESPSSDPDAVNKVLDVIESWGRDLGAHIETLSGGTRQLDFGIEENKPYILVLTHGDTVWPHGTLKTMPVHIENNIMYGPGVFDMKAGIVSLFHCLHNMYGVWPKGGIRVLATPDEEIGSDSSREHIETAAKGARVTLVVEPPVADSGHLKTGRKGVGAYLISFHGVASHAGNEPEQGASAISAAAEAVLALEQLANLELGTTVNVGVIKGGSTINVVPAQCSFELDVRASTLAEAERVDIAIRAWKPSNERVNITIEGGLNRPPFEQSQATLKLYALAESIADEYDFKLGHEAVGGGSDGNFTASICPTLDGLSAPGSGAHAAHEQVHLEGWPNRVRVLRDLLERV